MDISEMRTTIGEETCYQARGRTIIHQEDAPCRDDGS